MRTRGSSYRGAPERKLAASGNRLVASRGPSVIFGPRSRVAAFLLFLTLVCVTQLSSTAAVDAQQSGGGGNVAPSTPVIQDVSDQTAAPGSAKEAKLEAIRVLEAMGPPTPAAAAGQDIRKELALIHLIASIDGTLGSDNYLKESAGSKAFENDTNAVKILQELAADPAVSPEDQETARVVVDKVVVSDRRLTAEVLSSARGLFTGTWTQAATNYENTARQELAYADDKVSQNKQLSAIGNYRRAWQNTTLAVNEMWRATNPAGEKLLPVMEERMGTNPGKADTDADGLTDAQELTQTGTDPIKPDSATADSDADGLTDKREVAAGTNPTSTDTDRDGLTDRVELDEFRSDPLKQDTDADGLTDDSEKRLGTDPRIRDKDADGTPDGLESYTSTKDASIGQGIGVEMTGRGDVARTVEFQDLSQSKLFQGVPGQVSEAVDITSEKPFSKARVKIKFDPSKVPNGDVSGLRIVYWDETKSTFVALDGGGVDTQGGYIWADTTHFTTFLVVHKPSYDDAWDNGLNGQAGDAQFAWASQFGTTAGDSARSAAAGPNGEAFVVGSTAGSLAGEGSSLGSNDAFIRKFSPSGERVWTVQLGSNLDDSAFDVAADGQGNVYAVGRGNPENRTTSGAFLTKYSAAGTKLWTKQFNGGNIQTFTVDPRGNAYMVININSDVVLAKYDPNGNVLDSAVTGAYGCNGSAYLDIAYGSGAGPGEDPAIYVTGEGIGYLDDPNDCRLNNGTDELFLVKFDSNLNKQWHRQFGNEDPDDLSGLARGVAVDSNGDPFVVGQTSGIIDTPFPWSGETNNGGTDYFVVKYSGNGDKLWALQLGTPGTDTAVDAAVGPDDELYVTGSTTGALEPYVKTNAGGRDAFVTTINELGLGADHLQFGSSGSDAAAGVAYDASSGGLLVAGNTDGPLFEPESAGSTDAFALKVGLSRCESDNPDSGADTDKDGLSDFKERDGFCSGNGHPYKTDPNDRDTDDDGLMDGDESGTQAESAVGQYQQIVTDPTKADTDSDGVIDPVELDGGTDPWMSDSDSDMINDANELDGGFDPTDPNADGDYRDDDMELQKGSDPYVYDEYPGEDNKNVVLGFVYGDFGENMANASALRQEQITSAGYVTGWLASGLVVIGDLRDTAASLAREDELDTLLNVLGLVPGYGDAAKAVKVLSTWASWMKDSSRVYGVGAYGAKYFPDQPDIMRQVLLKEGWTGEISLPTDEALELHSKNNNLAKMDDLAAQARRNGMPDKFKLALNTVTGTQWNKVDELAKKEWNLPNGVSKQVKDQAYSTEAARVLLEDSGYEILYIGTNRSFPVDPERSMRRSGFGSPKGGPDIIASRVVEDESGNLVEKAVVVEVKGGTTDKPAEVGWSRFKQSSQHRLQGGRDWLTYTTENAAGTIVSSPETRYLNMLRYSEDASEAEDGVKWYVKHHRAEELLQKVISGETYEAVLIAPHTSTTWGKGVDRSLDALDAGTSSVTMMGLKHPPIPD